MSVLATGMIPLPNYTFSVEISSVAEDPIILRLASIGEAKREAANTIGAMILDFCKDERGYEDISVAVADDRGLTLFSMYFGGIDAPAFCNPLVHSATRPCIETAEMEDCLLSIRNGFKERSDDPLI